MTEIQLTIGRGDDMHLHVRQGDRLKAAVPHTARQFGRAIIMPNTTPYTLTVDDAARYRDEVLAAVPRHLSFTPLMTLYLQTTMSPDTIRAAKKSGFVHGIKMYPAGVTTNSDGGVTRVQDVEEQIRVMEEVDIPLLLHGESTGEHDDVFHREAIFYDEAFEWLTSTFPRLRIVCEHITTAVAARRVAGAAAHLRVAATITPQHLLENRNYLLGNGLRPHAYCKPILKKEEDRIVLVDAATSGNPRFFLGTDSAPHPKHGPVGKAKETDCGCAGCFTAHAALELYAEAFEKAGQLDRLHAFASRYGADFYELPHNSGSVTLIKRQWNSQPTFAFGTDELVPFRYEQPLSWRMLEN